MRLTLVRRLNTLSKDLFKIHPSLAGGSSRTEAVVALESTVITHGMPYPQNLKLALSMEAIITEHGARPATIAVMDGKVSVGLNEEELSDLAKSKSCRKVSRRDLSDTLSKGLHGGTTVAATMLLAHRAGISVFATGGIGGVHRDGENSLDISADLTELGRTPVAVVCAGAKSILDIPRTLEFLETQGVCVATIGDTSDFPSFFSRKSGHHSPCHVANVQKAAELIHIQNRLNLQTGILFAVPIPQEDEIPNDQVEEWLQVALKEADSHDVRGRDITPFLLKRLTELSNGRTLTANLALLRNNAKVGAQIAVALKKLQDSEHGSCSYSFRSTHASQTAQSTRLSAVALEDEEKTGRPVVIGGTVLDIMASWNSDFQVR
ncbi:Pseudouridine-5'-phosphate glycosidase [Hypsibius exemplaris]|uniref:Pseudouridine-5'-phosphate glycosidase n=1 Tax=Hypsibius exemplaris TaxID=2072580 RepID=A0A1W0WMD8_HYPEX|nr:Pseudouridine-5'-phosphate glycosidase [Hypsibius exemplaris]